MTASVYHALMQHPDR